jgi:hypothetical protein
MLVAVVAISAGASTRRESWSPATPSRVENFLAYNKPVPAVADATVTEVLDELDDQVPGSLPDPPTITVANVDGNHVILDLGRGLYAFYAHLKKGSKLGAKKRETGRQQPQARRPRATAVEG